MLICHYFGFPLIESGRYVLELPVSLNLHFLQALICDEAAAARRLREKISKLWPSLHPLFHDRGHNQGVFSETKWH